MRLIILFLLITLSSCGSQKPINYTKDYSYGFYHGENIYFMLDYRVWQKGRNFWFIMPIEGRTKVFLREIYFYSYNPESQQLKKKAVLQNDDFFKENLHSSQFVSRNDSIIFSYLVNYAQGERLFNMFIWDTAKDKMVDSEYENPVITNSDIYIDFFGNYISPWYDNPGIIKISRLKKEILNLLDEEDYDLPEKW